MNVKTIQGTSRETGAEAISHHVVETVADELGVDPVKLPSLYETIDPDALDAFFAPSPDYPPFGEITFNYAGFDVTVSYDGETVIALDERPPAAG